MQAFASNLSQNLQHFKGINSKTARMLKWFFDDFDVLRPGSTLLMLGVFQNILRVWAKSSISLLLGQKTTKVC